MHHDIFSGRFSYVAECTCKIVHLELALYRITICAFFATISGILCFPGFWCRRRCSI